jgi:hypothetical protein
MSERTFNFGNISMNVTGDGIKYNAFDINATTGEVQQGRPVNKDQSQTQQWQSSQHQEQQYCNDPCCDILNCDGRHYDSVVVRSGIGHFGKSENSKVTMDLSDNLVLRCNENSSGGTIGVLGDVKNATVNIKAHGNMVMEMDKNMASQDQMKLLEQLFARQDKNRK